MTREELKTATNDELIYALNYCGYDSYYRDYRDDIVAEIKKRMQEPVLDKIFCIVHPLSIMSTPELEHKAIMQIEEMLEPLCLPESEG